MNQAWRTLIPNLFTATSAVFGMTSMWLSVEGNYYWAAWFILWSALLDKADGTAARLLKGSSKFGMEFDSMADLIAFGLAPAMLVASAGSKLWFVGVGQWGGTLLLTACAFYALMAVVRLARFNLIEPKPGERNFIGLPSTLAGVIVPAAFLLATKNQPPQTVLGFFPVLMLVLALGMVSNMPVPKIKPRASKAFNVFQVVNAVACYTCGMLMVGEEYFLLLLVSFVLIGTSLELIRGHGKQSQVADENASAEAAG